MSKPTSKSTDRADRLMPGGVPRYVRCYDNGGLTADRYTVVYTGRYNKDGGFVYLGASENPTHPQGVGYHGSQNLYPIDVTPKRNGASRWPPVIGRKHPTLGRRIAFTDLPAEVQAVVIDDYKKLWEL